MKRQRGNSRGPYDSLDERLKACPSWVQQSFAHLHRACLRISRDATIKDVARYEGRAFYGGPKQRLFCRIDPNSKRIGVRFDNAISDLIRAKGMLRNRKGLTWIFVEENTDLAMVATLIEKSWIAVQSA